MRLRRVLVATVACLATVASVFPAQAAPPVRAQAASWSSPQVDYRKHLTKAERADLAIATTIFTKNNSTKTLDYRKADKHDGGRVTARRQYAAGWIYGGKKVTHISKAERARVMKYVPKKRRTAPASVVSPLSGPRGTNCTGVTKDVVYAWPSYGGGVMSADFWYDSCDTNWLIAGGASAGLTSGVVATILKKVPAGVVILAVVGALQGIGAAWLGAAKSNSNLNAVIIKIRYTYAVWAVPQ